MRRFARSGCALALIFTLVAGAAPSIAAPLTRASAEVDLHGVAAIAAHVRRTLPGRLAAELYNRSVEGYPAGARLVVRVEEIYLSHDSEGRFGGGLGGFLMPDAIRGEVRVVNARGQIIDRKSVTASSSANSSGGLSPDNEPRRVQALVNSLAYWAVRKVGR